MKLGSLFDGSGGFPRYGGERIISAYYDNGIKMTKKERKQDMTIKELHDIDEELRQEHLEQFGEAYPCGYVDYCNYCDIDDTEYPCAKAKIRMESET